MKCNHPFIRDRTVSRIETMVNSEARLAATPFPCGQCLPCRINQARVWQTRIMLESLTHGDNLWVTLTYNDEHLPDPPCVSKKEIQKFLKRLRRKVGEFRYFIVGEYGDKTWRPHYHCCFFGLSIYHAQIIFQKWGKCDASGFRVGKIEEHSARYTAGYTTQKLTKRKEFKYNGLAPEFMLSSRANGGIGYPAIVQIAEQYRSSKWREEGVQRTLRLGKQEKPIGRYLTVKLNELIGLPKEIFDEEFYQYQEELLSKHKKGDALDYYESLEKEDKAERNRKERLYKMFRRRQI